MSAHSTAFVIHRHQRGTDRAYFPLMLYCLAKKNDYGAVDDKAAASIPYRAICALTIMNYASTIVDYYLRHRCRLVGWLEAEVDTAQSPAKQNKTMPARIVNATQDKKRTVRESDENGN